MRISVLFQHYHTPDCATAARPWSLVRTLAEHHDVTVLTTGAFHERRLTNAFEWAPAGARVKMLDVPYANEMTTGERLRSYLTYAARAARTGLRIQQPDLIYASSTPLTVGAVGALMAARWRCPWVFEVNDLWPDFPVQMGAFELAGPAQPLLERALYGLERALYRSATHVVTVSPDMAAHVRRFAGSDRVSSVPYGTDFDLLRQATADDTAALRREIGVDETRPIVLYAGSFGRANAIPTLVEAGRKIARTSNACFVFAGHRRGYHRPLLERAAREMPHHVRLLAPQPYWRSLALFGLADVSLVSFVDRPVLATNAPSKLFDSLAAGTPVVLTQDGWTRAFVEEHDCGWYVPAERPARLAQRLAALLHGEPSTLRAARSRAREAARTHFDRRVHMNNLLSIIERTARRSS